MLKNMILEKKNKKLLLPILAGVMGLTLLIFAGLGQNGKRNTGAEEVGSQFPSPREYAEELEGRVAAICSRVEGAGAVHVTVSLKGTYRAIYATDWQSSSSASKSTMVLVGSGSSEEAVLIGYENPEIAGIGIVCSGGDRVEVQERILSLVSAAFDVSTHKIFIAAGQ